MVRSANDRTLVYVAQGTVRAVVPARLHLLLEAKFQGVYIHREL